MCTVAVAFYPQSETPLVITANRDENPTRPAEPWAVREFEDDDYYLELSNMIVPSIYCPLDVRGGTWIGCNSMGVFCAITNWDIIKGLHGLQSRGDVVLETLKRHDLESIVRYWRELEAKDFKPFNILAGGKDWLLNLSCNHRKMAITKLPAGLHVSTGWGLNQWVHREKYLRDTVLKDFEYLAQPVSPYKMRNIMSHHNDGEASEHSVCVHDPEHRWETRSSSMLALHWDRWELEYNNTAPCKPGGWNHDRLTLERGMLLEKEDEDPSHSW